MIHNGDTEDTKDARRIPDFKFEISNPVFLCVLRVSVVNFNFLYPPRRTGRHKP
jgi:hypothetical protein